MDFHHICPIFILAMAISVDGFAVGITYGIRGIKIGFLPLLLVGGISTIAIYLTSTLGTIFASLIGPKLAKNIGGLILIGIGIWIIYSTYANYNKEEESISEKKLLVSLRIKSLGIIINILKEPTIADFDKSGTINYLEATFLGFALALDAVGVGLGIGMTGISGILLPAIIGLVSLLFVFAGFLFGKKLGDILPDYFKILPGFVIIFLGVMNFL